MRILLLEDHRAMRELIADRRKGRGLAADAVGREDHVIAAVQIATKWGLGCRLIAAAAESDPE